MYELINITGEHPCQSFYNVTSVKQSLFSDGSDTQ